MCVAYLFETKRAYPYDDETRRKFRNDVIHDGKWPSREEATDYASFVYSTLIALASELRGAHQEPFDEEATAHVFPAHREARKVAGTSKAGFSTLSIISLIAQQQSASEPQDFATALGEWSTYNWWDLAKEVAPPVNPDEPEIG